MNARRLFSLTAVTLSLAVSASLAVTVRATAPGGNWPQWRGPLRDGVSTETDLLTRWPQGGPPKLWTASGLGRGFSTVAITNGRVFTMGDRRDGQYVIALDEETGKEIWAKKIGAIYIESSDYSGPRGTPTVDGDLLYAIDTDSDVVCLESATGKERWRKNMERDFGGQMMSGWNWAESPLVDGERVVVTPGGARAGMVALDKHTGIEVWRSAFPRIGTRGRDGAGYSSIVISNGGGVKQYVQMAGRGLVGVRASDGVFLWGNNSIANDVANIATPLVKDNYVFASTSYGAGSVMVELTPAASGRVSAVEKYVLGGNTFQNHHGGFVLVDKYIYGGHGQNGGVPVCVELATGKMMWQPTRNAGEGSAAVLAADGHLYFRYQNGVMILIEASPASYTEKGSFEIPGVSHPSWSHPVIAAKRLYLREQDTLYVYDIRR
jgi:outer membrane protein assembly factor BamB